MSGLLSLAERIDMLFRASHSSADAEPTAEAIAEALRSSNVEVAPETLTALRSGDLDCAPPQLLTALATNFSQPGWYLTGPANDEQVIGVHVQLGLLCALRDSGVSRVRLRGRPTSSDREALIEGLLARGASSRPETISPDGETS
ncbi:hypothetical protein ACIRRA_45210 [Nocardia sp. NPDC101769]|uniref:hypothetical protein n=1 Tax=Nocardia sp. NPDC101769 TaxID=3364333 RepID=UPI0037FE7E1C